MNNIGKRLMPIYLIKFLEENYFDIIPENFGKRMVSRQFIAEIKALYDEFDGKPIDNYGRRMVPEYLIKAFSDIEYIEYTDDDVKYEKTVPTGALKYATIDMLGGMSYKTENLLYISDVAETAPTEYQPYFSGIRDSAVTSVVSKDSNNDTLDTLTIAAEVQALTGYGWGINDTCYNYIDYEAKKFLQNVIKTTNTTNFYYIDSYTKNNVVYTHFRIYLSDNLPKAATNNILANFNFDTVGSSYSTDREGSWIGAASATSTNYVFQASIPESIVGNSTQSIQSYFTTNPLILYYELATPIETDISQYIDNNFIEVEPTGSVTFTNEYEQPVPSEVTYLIKE